LIGNDFALAFEFFPTPSPLVEEDNEDDDDSASPTRFALPVHAVSLQQAQE